MDKTKKKPDPSTTDNNKSLAPQPRFVIAIGASAGGLDAINTFFSQIKNKTEAAFVVIQHLSPTYKSMMDNLLQKKTFMPVLVAEHGQSLLPNHVYLLPSSHYEMDIHQGKLALKKIDAGSTNLHFPIDHFLSSLAEDYQNHAIAVILSGTGSDGSKGISRIKQKGGLICVQEPASAAFDGMPVSAIDTHLVDIILPVAQMPHALIRYMSHPFVESENGAVFRQHLSEKTEYVEKILQKLNNAQGVNFTEYKPSTIARRIERRMGINNITDISDYYLLIQRKSSELKNLSQEILIGVTEFFRDAEAFETLKNTVLQKIFKTKEAEEEVRIWVSGCSTGEEAYSIAILCSELKKELDLKNSIRIFATDIDEQAISIAAKGRFSLGAVENISAERKLQYFSSSYSEYFVNDELRKMVIFAQHNLIKDAPFSNIDLVSCRNLLIYFQNSAQERAISFMHFALKKYGYLFLGVSETPGNLESYFSVINTKFRIYQKKIDSRIPYTRFSRHSRLANQTSSEHDNPDFLTQNISMRKLKMPVELSGLCGALLQHYLPPTILMTDDYHIIYVTGDISAFTRKISSGSFRGIVDDILISELSLPVKTGMHRARKEKTVIQYDDVTFPGPKGVMRTSIRIVFFDSEVTRQLSTFAISFINSDSTDFNKDIELIQSNNLPADTSKRLRELEEELMENKERLRVTIEELETTNEELQSANEELMAANEELQSTNEELQSVNEELYTVNEEYQHKIEEISTAGDDFRNLLNSSNIATVFLDNAMNIRSLSPAAVQLLGIEKEDVYPHFSKLVDENLSQKIKLYLKQASNLSKPIHFNFPTKVVKNLTVKATPYSNDQGAITGLTLVLKAEDIEEIVS